MKGIQNLRVDYSGEIVDLKTSTKIQLMSLKVGLSLLKIMKLLNQMQWYYQH